MVRTIKIPLDKWSKYIKISRFEWEIMTWDRDILGISSDQKFLDATFMVAISGCSTEGGMDIFRYDENDPVEERINKDHYKIIINKDEGVIELFKTKPDKEHHLKELPDRIIKGFINVGDREFLREHENKI
jgi:hypothetical protein